MKSVHHKAYAKNTIELINSLKGTENKKLAADNIRSLYRETSLYSIHYSNIRSALAVFFLSSSFYALSNFLEKGNPILIVSGLFLILFGFWVHILLTKNAQSALMHLVQIERILSLIVVETNGEAQDDITKLNNNYITYDGEKEKKQIISYFTYWSEPLLDEQRSWLRNAMMEDFTKGYLLILIIYIPFPLYYILSWLAKCFS